MKAIETLREQLAKIGATLDDSSEYTLCCDAPSGYVWNANGCRCIAIQYANNSQTWLTVALKESYPELKMGLVKVTDPEEIASHRWDTGEDDWGAAPDSPNKIEWQG